MTAEQTAVFLLLSIIEKSNKMNYNMDNIF